MTKITTCTGCLHYGLLSDSEPCWGCYGEYSMVRTRYEPDERGPVVLSTCRHCGAELLCLEERTCSSCRELERLIRANTTLARKILREVCREERGL